MKVLDALPGRFCDECVSDNLAVAYFEDDLNEFLLCADCLQLAIQAIKDHIRENARKRGDK